MLILGTFFSETNKHRIMKLYIATLPLSMHKLWFLCKHWWKFSSIYGNKDIDYCEKKFTLRKIIIIWKQIAQTLYIKHRLFIMNKATSLLSFTYLGLVVSEKNVPKID